MKKLTLIFALMVATGTFKAYAQDVVYTFEAPCLTPCGTDPCNGAGTPFASTVNTAVISSASAFNLGPGLGAGFSCAPMNGFAVGSPGRARWANNWPVTLSPGADYFVFTLTPSLNSSVQLSSISMNMQISSSGPTAYEIRMSQDGFVTSSNFVLASNTGTGWFSRSVNTGLPSFIYPLEIRIYGYSASTAAGSLRIDNVTIGASVTNLPIELISFTGEKFEQDVRLRWTTASEQDNEHFTLFRSQDATNATSWEEIGRVSGAGTSQSPIDYEYVDASPNIGTNYYLLRQTDFDGTFTSSNIVAVEFLASKDFSVFPNPTSRGSPVRTSKRINFIFDDLGKLTRFDSNNITLEVPGVYTLVHQSENGFSETIRLIVTP